MAGALRSAFVVGFTGETGRELVKELASCKRFDKVVLIGRRKVEYDTPELNEMEQRVVDFEKLDDYKDSFQDLDVGFCALGTSRREAGSAAAFRHIDYDYVMNVAKLCKEGGTKHFHYVSSAGADENSMMLYPKTKGEVEMSLKEVGFDRLSIYRPKMLERKNPRAAETFVNVVLYPIKLLKPSIMFTPCNLLAKCMINNCDKEGKPKSEVLLNDEIYRIGSQ